MRVPRATYRLQFRPEFGFRAAREVVSYLAELGISDVYASPVFAARPGSTHGYDVVDPTRLNPELGTAEEFEELTREVGERGLGWVQDVVPNHMAFDGRNPFLDDVLESGEASRYRDFFDVDWNPPYESLRGRILAPFLGSFYGQALENGEIRVRYGPDGFRIHYYDLSFPVSLESYAELLAPEAPGLRRRLGEDHPDCVKFLGILYALKSLPRSGSEERDAQVRFIQRLLRELWRDNPAIRAAVEARLRIVNGRAGDPDSFAELDRLLSHQGFRLCFWKVATEEINYRRFFAINDLISVRVEREEVFGETHALILDLVRQGRVTGLRIDHIDGLYDPAGYLTRVRAAVPDAYLVVEKILEPDEQLPRSWPVQGTTGYEFLNALNALFVRTESARPLGRLYAALTGWRGEAAELLYEKKELMAYRHMAGDLDGLARLLKEISSAYRHGIDVTLYGLKRALVEVMAAFPVYRTYGGGAGFARPEDPEFLTAAVADARRRYPNLAHELAFLEDFLLLRFEPWLPEEERDRWRHFLRRFQQYTGPLMAKGFEDTFLYVYNRFLTLNEVGGSPTRFGLTLDAFHAFQRRRRADWPHALNATATHDTKRGEDVRTRLDVLSELPGEWERTVRDWIRLNARARRRRGGRTVPDRNDEYGLYQTLVGAWPFREEEVPAFRERLRAYLVKAVREAKVHTTWLAPDQDYEEAFLAFVDRILAPDGPFLEAFLPFQRRVAHHGMLNSLAQVLIKATAPGVPDFYQGSELWDLSLVDPDNRRPVDYETRAGLLRALRAAFDRDPRGLLADLRDRPADGRIKLFLVWRALEARKVHGALFRDGAYTGLAARGPRADHVVAFARHRNGAWAVTAAPRFTADLVVAGAHPLGRDVWTDTALVLPAGAPGSWRDAITGREVTGEGEIPLAEGFADFPAALLIGDETSVA